MDVRKPQLKKYPKGSWVFKQNEIGTTMFIIHSGTIRLTRDIQGQLEDIGLLEKGDFFGEMSLLEDMPRTASAYAEDDTDVIEIDKDGFITLLKSNVEIPIRMIRKYALKLEEMNKKFEYLLQNKREYDKGIREIISQLKGTDSQDAKPQDDNIIATLTSLDATQNFKVTRDSLLIGRVDPVTNIIPDVDLTSLDIGRTVSRRHARITYVNDKLYIIEELGVTNGTFVNEERLNTGELRPLSNGDKIGFGKVELTLEIRI